MDQIKEKIDSLTAHFEKIPYLKVASEKVGIPLGQLVIGVMLFLVLFVLLGFGASLIIHAVGILYPAYMSFKAIESPSEDDDKLWLTYWTIFALYNFIDRFIDYLFFWVPCYFVIKLLVLVYMFFPETRGAVRFYNLFAKPIFKNLEDRIDTFLSSLNSKSN
ncbi:hypothetical protein SteCoe_21945 [Stentor coeruleus]|uniref:Protein YOP1 n=1 Tax=Stentor coeruleus TaxID=5963 RepID=A0A1R2BNC5_9CILI|nr:hypothetical protein SteCoe_21945 [Stentor coeruleus]